MSNEACICAAGGEKATGSGGERGMLSSRRAIGCELVEETDDGEEGEGDGDGVGGGGGALAGSGGGCRGDGEARDNEVRCCGGCCGSWYCVCCKIDAVSEVGD